MEEVPLASTDISPLLLSGKNSTLHELDTTDDKQLVQSLGIAENGELFVQEFPDDHTGVPLVLGEGWRISHGSMGEVTDHMFTLPTSKKVIRLVRKSVYKQRKDLATTLEQASDAMASRLQEDIGLLDPTTMRHAFMSYDKIAAYFVVDSRTILMARASGTLGDFVKFPKASNEYTPNCMFMYEHQIAKVSLDVLEALEYLRVRNLYYFDVKLANVLVYTDGYETKVRLGDQGSVIPHRRSRDDDNVFYTCTYPIAAYADGFVMKDKAEPVASYAYTYIVTVSLVAPLLLMLVYVQQRDPTLNDPRKMSTKSLPSHFTNLGISARTPHEVERGYQTLVKHVYVNWKHMKFYLLTRLEEFPHVSNVRLYLQQLLEMVSMYFERVTEIVINDDQEIVGSPIVHEHFFNYEQLYDAYVPYLYVNKEFMHLPMRFADYDPSLLRGEPHVRDAREIAAELASQ